MIYHDSLWRDAPSGATHWGTAQIMGDDNHLSGPMTPQWFVKWTTETLLSAWSGARDFGIRFDQVQDLHERPRAYRTAQQLTDEYLSEHREELETDVAGFLGDTRDDERLNTDHILSDLCFWCVLLERHLAAERAKIEKETL